VLQAEEAASGDRFGEAVHLDYPWLAVAASGSTSPATPDNEGAVYLFRHDDTSGNWTFYERIVDEPDEGTEVHLQSPRIHLENGQLLFATTEYDTGASVGWPGRRVNVVRHDDGSNEWGRVQVIRHPVREAGTPDAFGASLLMFDGHLLVGDPLMEMHVESENPAGGVWAYGLVDDQWELEGPIQAPYGVFSPYRDGSAGRHAFSSAMFVAGNRLGVSAPGLPLQAQPGTGALWLYEADAPRIGLEVTDYGPVGTTPISMVPFVFQIRIDNSAAEDATNVIVHLNMASNLVFASSSEGQRCWSYPPGTGSGAAGSRFHACHISRIPAGGHQVLEIDLIGERAFNFPIDASLSADQRDETPENRELRMTVNVTSGQPGWRQGIQSPPTGCSAGRGPWEALLLLGALLLMRRSRPPAGKRA
jgi:hypothetical protein